MSTLLPLMAATLALAAAFAESRWRAEDEPPPKTSLLLAAIALAVVLGGVVFWRQGFGGPGWYAAAGLGVGMVLAWFASAIPGAWAGALALGALASGLAHWFPPGGRQEAQLGTMAGAALGAWAFASALSGRGERAQVYAVAASVALAADLLGGRLIENPPLALAGTILVALIAAGALVPRLASLSPSVALAGAFLVLLVGAWVAGQRYMGMQHVWLLVAAGAAVGVAVHLALLEVEATALSILVAAALAIALGTLGFALRRGFGMSLCWIGAAGALALLRNPRGLLALSPLGGLVLYRVFREAHVDATRALDIGQHYALVGLAVGAFLPLVATEWRRGLASPGRLGRAGAVLWGGLIVAVILAVAAVLGPKGVVGFVAGLGFSGALELLRRGAGLHAAPLAAGAAAAATLVYGWMGDLTQLSRDDKMSLILPLAAGILVLSALVAACSPRARAAEARP